MSQGIGKVSRHSHAQRVEGPVWLSTPAAAGLFTGHLAPPFFLQAEAPK